MVVYLICLCVSLLLTDLSRCPLPHTVTPDSCSSYRRKQAENRDRWDQHDTIPVLPRNRVFCSIRCVSHQRLRPCLIQFLSADEDLLPFQWCCVNSSLCQLYLNKRPMDNCQSSSWNSPGGSSLSNRDPQGIGEESLHLKLHFSRHGEGIKYCENSSSFFKPQQEFKVSFVTIREDKTCFHSF